MEYCHIYLKEAANIYKIKILKEIIQNHNTYRTQSYNNSTTYKLMVDDIIV